jgi:hypothetical protein
MFGMSKHKTAGPADGKAPARPAAEAFVEVTLQLKPGQRAKLAELGGDAWVRAAIDKARLPKSE